MVSVNSCSKYKGVTMAERRMFAKTIIDSDAFLDMPMSTQALYFHLSMRADDDGFINNPKRIQRMIGASDDDLKLLIAKSFIIVFESGVVVIKHWKIHNYIRNDRYKPTLYLEEKALLAENENKEYTEADNPGIPNGYQRDTQDSIVKDNIVKYNIDEGSRGEEETTPAPAPTLNEINDYIYNHNLSVNPSKFFSYYNKRNWLTNKGNSVDWKAKIQEWDFDDKQKAEANSKPEQHSNPFLALAEKENLL